MSTQLTDTQTELLPPALTKDETRTLETAARRHWRAASRNALVFAAELRRLHDGGAHLVRGYDNFARYAEHTFDGLTASAAKQLYAHCHVPLTAALARYWSAFSFRLCPTRPSAPW